MSRFLVAASLVILPAVARADRIHLHNGKTFDDVVLVSQTQAQVRFRVASGEMSLPSSWVAWVEEATGTLEEYLDRQQSLAADPARAAEAYLALARWARARGLGHGFRESILMAGELEPGLDGLPPLMATIGYYRDPSANVWVAGRPAGQRAARPVPDPPGPRGSDAGSSENADLGVAAGLTRAIEALAQAELERSRAVNPPSEPRFERPERARTVFYPLVSASVALVAPGWVFPGVPLRPPGSDPTNPVIRKPANPFARALLARPPGSLLPVSAYQY